MATHANINKKQLGFWMLTALVAGNMIGSGVFLLPSSLASIGTIGIVAWIATAIGAIFLALVFAKLSTMVPKVGGPYAYCHAAFGEFVGFQIAYNYWIAVWVGNAAIIVAFIGYLSVFWPNLAGDRDLAFTVSLALLWSVTAINIIGIRVAGSFQVITTILKLIPLILIATVGLFFINKHNLTQFNITGHSNISALTAAAAITLWSFLGLESATVPADSVKNPTKNIPRATIVGTSVTALIYILSTIAIMGTIPLHSLSNSTAPYADAARVMFGNWAEWLVSIGAIISCAGALNGWTLLSAQVPLAAARDGLFPKPFAKLNKNGSPVIGLIISSTLISFLLLLTLKQSLVKQFTLIILLATLASLIPYFFTAMAEILLLMRDKTKFSGKRFSISVTIALIAGAYAFWAIIGSGTKMVYLGALLFFSSVPVYVWMQWWHKREVINSNEAG